MNKKWMILITFAIVIAGFIIGNFFSNKKQPIHRRASGGQAPTPKLVNVINKDIQAPVEISGHLYAYDKLEIFAEVSGILIRTDRQFREGTRFAKGEPLIRIDDRVYRNNVLAQRSSLLNQLTLLIPDLSIDFPDSVKRWENYLRNLKPDRELNPLPEPNNEKERYYIASRNIFNAFYSIKSMEATLAKYTIRAPFDGMVTQSGITPGTLVRVGQKLGEFTHTGLFELEAPVGLFDLNRIRIGQTVKLTARNGNGSYNGRIVRINSVLDRNSMTVKIFVRISESSLKEGMYLTGNVSGDPIPRAYTIPKDLLVGQNRVYVVVDNRLTLKNINVIGEIGDRVVIRGLPDGTRILSEPWPEAREGLQIKSD